MSEHAKQQGGWAKDASGWTKDAGGYLARICKRRGAGGFVWGVVRIGEGAPGVEHVERTITDAKARASRALDAAATGKTPPPPAKAPAKAPSPSSDVAALRDLVNRLDTARRDARDAAAAVLEQGERLVRIERGLASDLETAKTLYLLAIAAAER